MSPQLLELLFTIRQHPAFRELIEAVPAKEPRPYSPSKVGTVQEQQADWIYRSGCRAQHDAWRNFLTESTASGGGIPTTSQTEKS